MGEFGGLGGVVTGAGSGIGRSVALRLAGEGATVIAVDLREAALEKLVQDSTGKTGRIVPYVADVTDPEQVRGYADFAAREAERFWFFHNNAGVEGAHKSLIGLEVDEWRRALSINLDSYFYGLKYVLPHLVSAGGGAVVLTGSLLSGKAAAGRGDYTVPKHAVLGLARTAAVEHAKDGIKINCICPGPIETPLMVRSEVLTNEDDPMLERRRFESGTPMGRYGTPEEVAETVAFLLSRRVPYLTGAALSLDGGLQAV